MMRSGLVLVAVTVCSLLAQGCRVALQSPVGDRVPTTTFQPSIDDVRFSLELRADTVVLTVANQADQPVVVGTRHIAFFTDKRKSVQISSSRVHLLAGAGLDPRSVGREVLFIGSEGDLGTVVRAQFMAGICSVEEFLRRNSYDDCMELLRSRESGLIFRWEKGNNEAVLDRIYRENDLGE